MRFGAPAWVAKRGGLGYDRRVRAGDDDLERATGAPRSRGLLALGCAVVALALLAPASALAGGPVGGASKYSKGHISISRSGKTVKFTVSFTIKVVGFEVSFGSQLPPEPEIKKVGNSTGGAPDGSLTNAGFEPCEFGGGSRQIFLCNLKQGKETEKPKTIPAGTKLKGSITFSKLILPIPVDATGYGENGVDAQTPVVKLK